MNDLEKSTKIVFLIEQSDDVCREKGRSYHDPVVLKIKLEAVSRPGVMFSDWNATRHDAVIGDQPDISF